MSEPQILVETVFFLRNLLPILEAMGWTVRYGPTYDSPRGHVVIHGISNGVEPLIRPELREQFTRILDALAAPLDHPEGKLLWHYASEEDELQWQDIGDGAIAAALPRESAPTPGPEPGTRPLPPLGPPVLDYTRLRENPENDRRIREYSDHMIIVTSRYMVEVVKPHFAARGWLYGGNHYGDGSVGLQVVVDADDSVVAPATVLGVLMGLQVPHRIHHRQSMAEDGTARIIEDRVVQCGCEGYGDDEEPAEDRRPLSLDEAEEERQEEARAAMEAEEEKLEPGPQLTSFQDVPCGQLDATGALQLEEGDEMHIRAVYIPGTDGAELRLEIGSNVITVVSSYKQAADLLVEAGYLAAQLMSDRQRNLEEAESDGGKESERDELPE